MIQEDKSFNAQWHNVYISIEHWHFHRQLLKRYGIILAPGAFSQILKDIRNGKAILIERRSRKQALYSVRISSVHERIYVLISAGDRIITAWPPQKRLNAIRRRLTRDT